MDNGFDKNKKAAASASPTDDSSFADLSRRTKEKVEDYCRQHPWTAVAVGVGVGVGIGLSPLAPWIPRILTLGSQNFLKLRGEHNLGELKVHSIVDSVFEAASKIVQEKFEGLVNKTPQASAQA